MGRPAAVEGGQCREGAFAAASTILTGALLLIHPRGREGGRGEDKMGGRGNKGTLEQFIWRANTTLTTVEGGEGGEEGDRPVEFSPPPSATAMPSRLTEQTLP